MTATDAAVRHSAPASRSDMPEQELCDTCALEECGFATEDQEIAAALPTIPRDVVAVDYGLWRIEDDLWDTAHGPVPELEYCILTLSCGHTVSFPA